jgi:hypothetical protein
MKNTILLFVMLSMFSTMSSEPGPSPQDAIDPIILAFSKGNAEDLSLHFNSTVEITTPTGEGTYSKAQAKQVMLKFFSQNKPDQAAVIHKGTSGSGASFFVVSLNTDKGPFRVTVYLKQEGSKYLIQEIDIEK